MQEPDSSQARAALAEIERRRSQVVERSLVPAWYWPAIAVPTVGLGAVVDSGQSLVIAIAAIVYASFVAALSAWIVFGGHGNVKVSQELLGADGSIAITVFVLVLVVGSLAIGLGSRALGFGYPATLGTLLCGAGLTIGGPLLMGFLRRLMLSRDSESGSRR